MQEFILIVDDDKDICRLVGIYLGNEGYRYLACENAAQALDILELQPDGKKAMASPAFLLGHPVSLGTILTKQE